MFPPFRAEHIGSLLRPPELLATRRAFDGGRGSQLLSFILARQTRGYCRPDLLPSRCVYQGGSGFLE